MLWPYLVVLARSLARSLAFCFGSQSVSFVSTFGGRPPPVQSASGRRHARAAGKRPHSNVVSGGWVGSSPHPPGTPLDSEARFNQEQTWKGSSPERPPRRRDAEFLNAVFRRASSKMRQASVPWRCSQMLAWRPRSIRAGLALVETRNLCSLLCSVLERLFARIYLVSTLASLASTSAAGAPGLEGAPSRIARAAWHAAPLQQQGSA